MDHLTRERRSWNMSRIHSKGTNPEVIVRKVLTRLGWHYRLHARKLPGKPDVIISKAGTIIFINGCFWHQHKGCKRQTIPKANKKYWLPKLKRNIQKQKEDVRKLRKDGWKVNIIWECETKDETRLTKKLKKIL